MSNIEHNKNLICKEIAWLEDIRTSGKNSFTLPAKKQEYWQYTNLDALKSIDYKYANQQSLSDFDIDFNGYKIFFEDGFFSPKKSSLPEGLEVLPLVETIITSQSKEYLGKLTNENNTFFVALNNANIQEGVYINVEKNINIKKPIAIINHSTQNNAWHNIRNIIVVNQGSSVEFVEYFTGTQNANYFCNVVNEFFVEDNARLNHYKVQNESLDSFHVSFSAVNVKKDGTYNNITLQTGAQTARNEVKVNLLQEGACANVDSIYKTKGTTCVDNTITINHLFSNTTSNQLVKGVADSKSKASFQGKISIKKDCTKIEGNQQHRAILLSNDADINTKPELEIFADDVKCSHGCAIGKLDDNALFYMCSRGIPKKEAEAILIETFLQECIEKVQNLDIKKLFTCI